jgi:D-ribose pyranase
MKRFGHLNRDISRVLARMGHTDSLVIADCGLPVPDGIECIDVSLALGDPGFARVLNSILTDFQAERAVFAKEALECNSAVAKCASSLERAHVRVEFVLHESLKELVHHARMVIRTGEASPFANAVLFSGVVFGAGK